MWGNIYVQAITLAIDDASRRAMEAVLEATKLTGFSIFHVHTLGIHRHKAELRP